MIIRLCRKFYAPDGAEAAAPAAAAPAAPAAKVVEVPSAPSVPAAAQKDGDPILRLTAAWQEERSHFLTEIEKLRREFNAGRLQSSMFEKVKAGILADMKALGLHGE